jgi:hypothetical protein
MQKMGKPSETAQAKMPATPPMDPIAAARLDVAEKRQRLIDLSTEAKSVAERLETLRIEHVTARGAATLAGTKPPAEPLEISTLLARAGDLAAAIPLAEKAMDVARRTLEDVESEQAKRDERQVLESEAKIRAEVVSELCATIAKLSAIDFEAARDIAAGAKVALRGAMPAMRIRSDLDAFQSLRSFLPRPQGTCERFRRASDLPLDVKGILSRFGEAGQGKFFQTNS